MVMVGFSYRPFSGFARYIGQFTQGVALGYHLVPLWGENRRLQIAAFSQIDPLAVGLGVAPRASYTTSPFALWR
jgi:hypothetical protein